MKISHVYFWKHYPIQFFKSHHQCRQSWLCRRTCSNHTDLLSAKNWLIIEWKISSNQSGSAVWISYFFLLPFAWKKSPFTWPLIKLSVFKSKNWSTVLVYNFKCQWCLSMGSLSPIDPSNFGKNFKRNLVCNLPFR